METSSGGRKRKSLVDAKRKSKASNRAESSDEDEWLCARTFKASKIDKETSNPKEITRKTTKETRSDVKKAAKATKTDEKQTSEITKSNEKQAAKWINRKSLNLELAKSKAPISSKTDVKNRISQIEKVWNVHTTRRKNVIEEVTSCVPATPPMKTSNSVMSNASDVVPDSYTSTSSSSSSSSRKSESSVNARRSPFPKAKSYQKSQEKVAEKRPTCESPVLPCTPIRTSNLRRISQVVQDIAVEDSPKDLSFQFLQSPINSQSWRSRRNSIGSWASKSASNTQSSASDTPKRFSRRSSLVNLRMDSVDLISQKREASPVITETMDFLAPLTVHKEGNLEKVDIDYSQKTSPVHTSVFKAPVNIEVPEQSTPDIEESCSGFQIQETCHVGGLSENSTSGTERFEIDDLDGKSIRCDDYMPKLISAPVSTVRENLPRKRLPKLAGRLAKHLSSIRCERLIVRRDPRAVIISLPISQTYSNWGITVHEVSATGQLVIVRDKLLSSRTTTSSFFSNNQANNWSSSSLQTETTKYLAERDIKVSKSHQIVPPPPSFSFSSAGSALRAVVGAGTDSASSTAVECWLHLAQPYSLIRTSSRQPPAIINPIVIDR